MEDEQDKKQPRAAVVVYTAVGERLKPKCPVCGWTYWGRLVPPGYKKGQALINMLPVEVAGKPGALEVQLWTCLNCGHLWHRTGAASKKPVEHDPNPDD